MYLLHKTHLMNQSQIAKELGISRTAVYHHLFHLGLAEGEGHRYDGMCCICGKKPEEGMPVCLRDYCMKPYMDMVETCRESDRFGTLGPDLGGMHVLQMQSAGIHGELAPVEFPDTADYCSVKPAKVFYSEAEHVRYHHYTNNLSSGVKVNMRVPKAIYTSVTYPKKVGVSPGVELRREQKRRGKLRDGREIATLRARHDISQRRLAREAGISVSAVYYYETGERIPNANIAVDIARVLRCRVRDLWPGRNDSDV